MIDEGIDALLHKIESERGFNCSFYKSKCLQRRLAVRMRARGVTSFERYTQLLDSDPAEYEMLLDTLTVNVTKFFRDPPVWARFAEQVVPALFDLPGDERRVWSAGCASGEEAYSVSILLREYARVTGRLDDLERFRILGTDIDRRSLEAADRAEYPELSLSETPPELRERWFSPGPRFSLCPEARRNVGFARRDLISDEPERGQSLIVCRNVIIYFERPIQEVLFRRFHDALVPGGYLVLGKVETLLGPTRPLFQPLSGRERIFRKPV